MVSKKGYIKTLEAVIATIIIVIVGYMLIPRTVETSPEVPLTVEGVQNFIDQSIQFNETMRALITRRETDFKMDESEMLNGIKTIIDQYTPPGYDYTCTICSNPGTCLAPYTPIDKSIYMTDVLIASSGREQNPRVVRIWFWRRPTSQKDQEEMNVQHLFTGNLCYFHNTCLIKVQEDSELCPKRYVKEKGKEEIVCPSLYLC